MTLNRDVVTSANILAEPIRLQRSFDCVVCRMIFSRKTSTPYSYFKQDWDVLHHFVACVVLSGAVDAAIFAQVTCIIT